MSYNLTAITTNTTGLLSFTQGVNDTLMFGWLGVLLLIGIFCVLVISFYYTSGDIRKAFGAASFISFGLSLLLKAVGLIPDLAFFLSLIICALIVGFSFIGGE